MSDKTPTLNDDQKRQLYHDGYYIMKNVVPDSLVQAALDRIHSAKKGESLSGAPEITDLINRSHITPIVSEVMGQFDPPKAGQVGVLPRRDPGDYYNNLGYRDRDFPYFGAETHSDGLCTIQVPQEVQTGAPDEIYRRFIASGPKGDLGRSPEVIGHNTVPLFEDPVMTLGLGSFTCFVFVCLNDQTVEGCGQTAIIPGAHHAMERFFQWQRSQGDRLGPEGPGWPRLDHDCANRCGHVYLPERVRNQYIDETSECTPDGRKWPRPTQVLMNRGDAAIITFHMPHSGTRNQYGTESRKNMIFRLRNKKQQPDVLVNGVTDHPDRGQLGEWLTFPEGNDPWKESKDVLCDQWINWDGMQEIVRNERLKDQMAQAAT